jgi:hypothetical protein
MFMHAFWLNHEYRLIHDRDDYLVICLVPETPDFDGQRYVEISFLWYLPISSLQWQRMESSKINKEKPRSQPAARAGYLQQTSSV